MTKAHLTKMMRQFAKEASGATMDLSDEKHRTRACIYMYEGDFNDLFNTFLQWLEKQEGSDDVESMEENKQ